MKIIVFLFIALNLYADTKQEMFYLYQNNKFEKVCTIGFNNFKNNKKDEEYISLYAFACLYSDYIDRLAVPTAILKTTEESRSNAAYFSTILMQKKLLYHAMVDHYDLSSFILPTTDYVLSKVFDLYAKLGNHTKRTFYLFEDPNNPKLTYKLFLLNEYNVNKIVIEEFYDTISIKRHVYW